MAYKALYRSYRPTSFKEVVGQKHVIQTLKNAVKDDRTSHAYVFSGLRGIGKTTIARILAKAVNCENLNEGEPCNCCAACQAINNNETTDIVELDAASNNGVDEIRNILDRVNFLPSSLKKKVYIIDEVHMLSQAAFNALLKTLEEPPAYVMFILATTEPHKIPMTILSRCQRFDFKQLTNDELTEELKYVCSKEGLKITDDALIGIAEAAEGGMRDALSILDQASVYADDEITIDDVNSITGNISNQKLIELVKAFNENNATKSIEIVDELLNMGKEVSRLTIGVIQFCRDLLLIKSIDNFKSTKNIYNNKECIELAEQTDNKKLFYYIDVLVDVQNKIRYTNSQKIYLEVGIMKIVNHASEDIDILGRIQALEERIYEGNVPDYVPSSSGVSEQKIQTIENKLKKITNDLEKANIISFEEKVNSRIGVLEDVVSRVSVLPDAIDQRVQTLERVISSDPVSEGKVLDNDTETKLNSLEAIIKANDLKCEQLFEAITGDLQELKPLLTEQTPEEDVILELIEKVTSIEEKINNTPVKVDLSSTISNDILNDLTERINKLETREENYIYKEESVPAAELKPETTLFDFTEDETSKRLSTLENRLDALNQDTQSFPYNEELSKLKQEIDELKLNAISLSINEEVETIKSRLRSIEESSNNAPKQFKGDLDNELLELKTNYFVLTKALKYLTDKVEQSSSYDDSELRHLIDNVKQKVDEFETSLDNIKVVPIENKEQEEITRVKQEEVKEPVVEEVEEEKPSEPEPLSVNNDEDITSKVYDVTIVENVLHQSREAENRSLKSSLLESFKRVEDKVGGLLAPIARHLANGMLVANGNTHLLLVFPTAELCNVIMSPKNHEDAKEVLKITFNRDYDFIALPEDTWREKRLEYYNQNSAGFRLPKLSPINNPALKVLAVNREPQLTERQKVLQKANDFFGN